MGNKTDVIPSLAVYRWLQRFSLVICLLVLVGNGSRTFAANATLSNGGATMEVLGIGSASLLTSDLTDPENDGNEATGDTDPSWNWKAIFSNAEPGFNSVPVAGSPAGTERSYNVFDNIADGGGDNKWCCGEPLTGATLSASNPLNITVQFANRFRLTHFTITSGNDTPTRDPRDWQILGSNDGVTYEPIFTQIGAGTNATTTTNATVSLWDTTRNQVNKFTLTNPSRAYTYFRFQCSATYITAATGAFFQLTEIEYFGLPGGALTEEVIGTGTAALLKSDVTDPDNNGNKAAGPTDPSWNWQAVTANNKPAFGADGAFNVFDNVVGDTNKWCCDDATAASPLNVTVEFPRGVILTYFTVTSADDVSGAPTKFQILGSNDGTTFTPIYTRDSATSLWTGTNQVVRVDLQDPTPLYKFIKYEATETPGPTHQIAEIEYFGKYGGLNNPIISDIRTAAYFATLQVTDGADTILNPATAQLVIDGTNVTTTLTKVGTVTTFVYARSPAFASGSTHTWAFNANDDAGNFLFRSGSFTLPPYTTINTNYALASVNTGKAGFKARTHQMDIYRNPATGVVPNAERQFANGYIDPNTGLPYVNGADMTAAVGGYFEIAGVVNWNSTIGGASGAFPNDEGVPGIPGSGVASADRYVVAIETILELKAGVSYRFAVNSDDGFRLSFGWGPGDVAGTQLGTAGDRGFAESTMDVIVPVDGFYPVRLMFWDTGGGDGCEFYTVDIATGERILVNDSSNANAVKAYQESPVSRPWLSLALPTVNYGYAFADQDVILEITDGALPLTGTPILRINNVDQTITTGKTNNVTTIRRASSISNLLPSGANNLLLIYAYSSAGNTVNVTNTWAYTVPAYTWPIPVANKVGAATQVGGAGFNVRANQIDRSGDANQGNGNRHTGNNMPGPEIQLYGGYINPTNNQPYANLAAVGPNADGSFDISDTLNHNSNPPNGNTGIFQGNSDREVPGLPGTGTSVTGGIVGIENYVAEITTYLDLKAGAHVLGLNVDDGYTVTSAPNARDTLGTLLAFRNGPGGNAGSPLNIANGAFNVIVPEDGIYPFRILFWQGGGGVNFEFLEIDKGTGTQIPVNDISGITTPPVANSGNLISSITAYNTYTGPVRPWVKFSVHPMPFIGVTNPRVNGGAAVTLWQNRNQRTGPGPINIRLPFLNGSWNSGELQNAATATRPFGDAVGAIVADLGTSTVGMVLDGVSVTPTVTDVPGSTDKLVLYTPNPPLSPSLNHIAGLVYAGTTNFWIFNVIAFTNVAAADVLASSVADPNAAGFHVKVVQAAAARPGGNTAAAAEIQLAGTPANVATNGPNADGSYTISGIINWNVTKNPGNTPAENGSLQPLLGGPADDPVPGIPGTGLTGAARFENITAEIFAYLDLPAGYQKFGVNGDDGWRVQVGIPGQTNGTVLFTVDRGAGAADIPFAFVTPQAGLVPVRLVWYQGGGGGNVEFFTYGANGTKIPINDRSNPNSIKAYYNVNTGPQLRFTSATLSGGNATFTWSGTAILQQATVLTGTPTDWTDVNPQPVGNTYQVPVSSATQTFYRLKQ